MKVFEALASALARRNVPAMFGLIGDANLYMVDSFVRTHGGRYIAAANECGAVLMAIGHAQVSGGIGVATVTHGPGLTNTISALAEASRTHVPVVVLAGDTDIVARDHLQNIGQRQLVEAAGAGFVELRSPDTVAEDLALAFRLAQLECRAIVFNMPVNLMWQEAAFSESMEFVNSLPFMTPEGSELDNAIGIIAASRAPVVLAGHGAIEARHRAALVQLAARLGAPMATTLRANGLFSGEAFNLGIFGGVSTPPAAEAIAASDCIIAFGASLNQFTTFRGTLLKDKRVIQVDAHRPEIGRNIRPDASLIGDPAMVAGLFMHWLDEAEIPASGFTTAELAEALSNWREDGPYSRDVPDGSVDIRTALIALNDALPADRVVVTDVGRFMGESWKRFPVLRPRDFVHTCGFASVGLGMSEAIGASIGSEGRPTVLVAGDGGFMLGGLAEFNTAVRAGTDIIVIVCNDSSYGAEHIQFLNRQMDPSLSIINWPDLAPVAIALGGEGVTVRHDDDLPIAAAAIRDRRRPLLIDVKLHPEHIPPVAH